MVKRLGIFPIILLLSLTTFSQKDTSKICFDYKKAKQIAIDLTKGDSAMAELKVTKKLVKQLNEKIFEQDSIIKVYIKKDEKYISQVKDFASVQEKQSVVVKGLEKDVETLTNKNNNLKTGIKWLGGGFLGSLTALFILISIK